MAEEGCRISDVGCRGVRVQLRRLVPPGLPARYRRILKTRCFTSGQNSTNAFLPIRPRNPTPIRPTACAVLASVSGRQVFDMKLLPEIAANLAYAGIVRLLPPSARK